MLAAYAQSAAQGHSQKDALAGLAKVQNEVGA
jgi:hypothetical protein